MATVASALKSNKRVLRKSIATALRGLPSTGPQSIEEQSHAITARVLALPSFKQSNSLCCYLSMPSGEVNTFALALAILRSGKVLFIPRIDQSTDKMEFLRVYDEDDLNNLPSGVWGIKEPNSLYRDKPRENALDTSCEPLDIILMPGVAFDRSFSRLGHGKGFYDKYLSEYKAVHKTTPQLVALALNEQVLEANKVPMADHDWAMDCIVSSEELLDSNNNST